MYLFGVIIFAMITCRMRIRVRRAWVKYTRSVFFSLGYSVYADKYEICENIFRSDIRLYFELKCDMHQIELALYYMCWRT